MVGSGWLLYLFTQQSAFGDIPGILLTPLSSLPYKCTLVPNQFLPLFINGHKCDKTSALVPLILRLSLEKTGCRGRSCLVHVTFLSLDFLDTIVQQGIKPLLFGTFLIS